MIIIISLEKRKTNLVNDMKNWTKLISRSSCKNKSKYLPKLVKFKIRICHPLSCAGLLRNLKLIAKNIYLIYWLGNCMGKAMDAQGRFEGRGFRRRRKRVRTWVMADDWQWRRIRATDDGWQATRDSVVSMARHLIVLKHLFKSKRWAMSGSCTLGQFSMGFQRSGRFLHHSSSPSVIKQALLPSTALNTFSWHPLGRKDPSTS